MAKSLILNDLASKPPTFGSAATQSLHGHRANYSRWPMARPGWEPSRLTLKRS